MSTTVSLPCGHTVDVEHVMGERLVVCVHHKPLIELVVAANHTDAVTYTARRRTPEPTPEET